MHIRHLIHQKNFRAVLAALACVVIVAVCIGVAVFASARRHYQTVENPQAETSDLPSAPGGQDSPTGSQVTTESAASALLEQEGIAVTPLAEIPEALDPYRYVKQAYELKNLMAVDPFASVGDLPVNPVVQYAFCYLYADSGCLVDVKPGTMTYRQATEQEIRDQISRLFGSCPHDVKTSELYASGKQCFEMWQPDYSRNVYATATVRAADGGAFVIESTYYEDASRTKAVDTAVVTVKQATGGAFYLASMT